MPGLKQSWWFSCSLAWSYNSCPYLQSFSNLQRRWKPILWLFMGCFSFWSHVPLSWRTRAQDAISVVVGDFSSSIHQHGQNSKGRISQLATGLIKPGAKDVWKWDSVFPSYFGFRCCQIVGQETLAFLSKKIMNGIQVSLKDSLPSLLIHGKATGEWCLGHCGLWHPMWASARLFYLTSAQQ